MKILIFQTLSAASVYLLYCLAISSPSQAQISSDGTVPTNVGQSGNVFEITGGAQAGSNLFHSFKEFSVPTGSEAFFKNTTNISNIDNIITRVTGGSISNINGLIRENYGANLIFINPSGIIFGPNAQLNIGGSFLGSTASSIKFADGVQFSATNPQASPLLTVSVPVGLQFGQNPGTIRVQGTGHTFTVADPLFSPVMRNTSTGLRVQPNQTLALVGGDISIDGGLLTAEEGRVELGSVAEGRVSLNPNAGGWTLGYEGTIGFKDIEMRSLALADASGSGGSIQVQGQNFSVSDGSLVLIQNQGLQPAKAIQVNARESVKLSGTNADGKIRSSLTNETVGSGRGGDIDISTKRLIVEGGATVFVRTFSSGIGGNVNVNASESLEVNGVSAIDPSVSSFIITATYGSGDSGDNTVSTGRLTTAFGGNIVSTTYGTGKGGNLNVNATDSIEIIGVEPTLFIPSGLFATTINAGDAGDLTVSTPRLTVRDGGRVDASTFASGSAGSVTIKAPEFVEVKGTVPGSVNSSLIGSSANVLDQSLQQIFRLPAVPSGASQDVTINTNNLRVTDGGQVTVRNQGSGNAGNTSVNARSILVDNGGNITAATQSGEGGNIILKTDTLQMRHGSQISAEAGGTGNGGNITITGSNPTDFVVLLENSGITANAFEGRGGNIQINTQGLFTCPECQITASSQRGINGVVQFITPDVGANQEAIDVPQEIVQPEEVVVQACTAKKEQNRSEFTITGRGGLPPQPSELLSSTALVSFEPSQAENLSPSTMAIKQTNTAQLPPPARGWYVNTKGTIVLTANAPRVTPYTAGAIASSCHGQ
ncbi:filamentous hemagglutinin N-terminal domain-containing protein [Scytonema sp. UIC 10036]|uniref:beta strand repeat-containing protein n=1 Tax=Scytonema sp. UIC 10036 TaxID=2304196 RepID=UPI0012DAF492|nr:S-layer family protein [Scytonema sp. UIC 10036]MUG94300.1 filamentous hemagglutinin N-terminal domain-containing protein [Scytonema sp. UIC 10036]